MSANHEFQVVKKEVVFSEGEPVSPLKLFNVTGDVLASVVPIIKNGFSTEDAILKIGEQGKPEILYMDTKYEPEKDILNKPVSSDIYLTITTEGEVIITSGTVVFYCIFAKLSEDGEVEEVEE